MAEFRFGELSARFATRTTEHRKACDKLDRQIARLKAKRETLSKQTPRWIEEIVRPLALQIQLGLKGKKGEREAKVFGPHGIGARVSLHFHRTCIPYEERFRGDNCLGLVLEPGNLLTGEVRFVDVSGNTGRYAPGTLGEDHGLNYPVTPIPADATVDWFIARLKP